MSSSSKSTDVGGGRRTSCVVFFRQGTVELPFSVTGLPGHSVPTFDGVRKEGKGSEEVSDSSKGPGRVRTPSRQLPTRRRREAGSGPTQVDPLCPRNTETSSSPLRVTTETLLCTVQFCTDNNYNQKILN